ncbi:MAG: hypothetical protein LBQ39_06945 [Tannerellaceae bacterium]|nr:hypothetical protein [Tannerellaceae bacterium]
MKTTEKKATSIQEKRAYLKEISKGLSVLKKEGAIDSVNEGLKAIYAQQGHTELKTLKQWNREGKRVKRGETALLLWAKPKELKPAIQLQVGTETGEDEETTFFPICFVFSNLQIQEGR